MNTRRAARIESQQLNSVNSEAAYIAPIRSLQAVATKQKFKLNAAQKLCYCLAILALTIGMVQFARCCWNNLTAVQALNTQTQLVSENLEQARNERDFLKDQIKLYHSPLGAETIARERLNFVRDDEVLIQVFPTRTVNNKVANAE